LFTGEKFSPQRLKYMEEQQIPFENRLEIEKLLTAVEQLKTQLGRVISGQSDVIDLLLVGLLCDGHVLLEGVPGVAKTMLSKLMAKSLDISFRRLQFTPDLMPSDVLGTSVFNPKTLEFEYKPGPVFSNFILIDEINRSPAKTQAALFELMEERQITIDGTSYPMQEPFMVVATQNPIEQEGTYRLPEAQLDRFLLKVVVNYPSFEEELEMLKRFNYQKATDSIVDFQPVLSQEKLIELRQLVKAVLMDDNLLKYIAQITQVSRSNNQLELGISPRAAIAWMTASKAYAALQGRDFVTPDDIKSISNAVLRHRLILTPDAEMEGITADELLEGIINKTEIPR